MIAKSLSPLASSSSSRPIKYLYPPSLGKCPLCYPVRSSWVYRAISFHVLGSMFPPLSFSPSLLPSYSPSCSLPSILPYLPLLFHQSFWASSMCKLLWLGERMPYWSRSRESVSCSVASNSLQPHGLSPPSSSAHGILQVKILEWVAMPFSRGSSWPRDQTQVPRIAGRFFTIWPLIGKDSQEVND